MGGVDARDGGAQAAAEPRFRAVIFDMDGVLVDTEYFYVGQLRQYADELGMPVSDEELRRQVGCSHQNFCRMVADWFGRIGEEVSPDAAGKRFFAWQETQHIDYHALMNPGVAETLPELRRRGLRLALASSSRMENILEVLDACEIRQEFEVVVSGEEFRESKPNPEIYLHTLDRLGLTAGECCCVEDSVVGIAAGKAAGLTVVAKREERFGFSQDAADLIIDQIPDLLTVPRIPSGPATSWMAGAIRAADGSSDSAIDGAAPDGAAPDGVAAAAADDIAASSDSAAPAYPAASADPAAPGEDRLTKVRTILGEEAVARLEAATVLVFGCGGVGSNCIEALARGGIGRIAFVDRDVVSVTNINRQAIAYTSTIGKRKIDVMAGMVLDINPDCIVVKDDPFVLAENVAEVYDRMLEACGGRIDYVVDAIDTFSTKLALAALAQERGFRLISSMGGAMKLHPECLQITDISKTENCRFSRIMRKECRKRGIRHLKVIYSNEHARAATGKPGAARSERSGMGTVSFMPPIMGQMIAGEVIRTIAGVA